MIRGFSDLFVVIIQKLTTYWCCQMWYVLSKILAENVAWKFTKEHGIDMVVINPGMVIGPILQPSASSSVGMILDLVNGTSGTLSDP